MTERTRWNLRTINNCLFIDDVSLDKVVLQHNARPGLRPYIHPLRIGNGTVCLTEDSPWHHPWQHGIQTGFHGVNGCDFWFDPGQHPNKVIGLIEPSSLVIAGTEPPSWTIEALWRHADGSELLKERQRWSLTENASLLFLDLDWKLQAIPDVRIDRHDYGGLFIRMPFRRGIGATVLNDRGQRNDATEQQSAAWVDLYMLMENSGIGAGITVCDHPGNPNYPAHWRVDHQRGINPAPCIPEAIELPAGASLCHRYRLILHSGPLAIEQIERLWRSYTEEEFPQRPTAIASEPRTITPTR